VGRGIFLVRRLRLYRKGAWPKRSPILGFSFYLCIHRLTQTTKFDVVTRVGRGVHLGSAIPPIATAEFQRSPILGVLLYLCLHPLTQNDQIRHGNTYGDWGWGVFRRSATPLHLHNASRRLSAIDS